MLAFVAAVLTGCSLYSVDRSRPETARILPETYASPATGSTAIDRYWESFGSAELDRLVAAALERNYGIAAAEARLRQAGYGARVAWTGRLPSFEYQAGAGTSFTNDNSVRRDEEAGVFELGAAGRYEIDIWGRRRADHLAAINAAEAAQWRYRTAQMSISAEVMLRWVEVVVAEATKRLLAEQLESAENVHELLKRRLSRGAVDLSEVLAQRQSVLGIQEELANVKRRRAVAEAELQYLLGGEGTGSDRVTTGTLPAIPPLPQAGIPADLLTRRPDVRSAWNELLAAEWAANSAHAARLPTLGLTGSFLYRAATPQSLFENWVATLVGGVTGPLFEFGARKYAALEAEAGAEAQLAELRDALLAAYRDTEAALAANRYLEERGNALRLRVDVAGKRAARVLHRYRNGAAQYIEVYVAENDRRAAERALLAWHADMLMQRVQLARALGGGWSAGDEVTEENNDE